MAEYDMVVRNGTLSTASDVFRADIGIIDGRIATIGARLGGGRCAINADGHIVTPGCVDSHCHIEQRSAMIVMPADDCFTATRSASCARTSTGIAWPGACAACGSRGDVAGDLVGGAGRRADSHRARLGT